MELEQFLIVIAGIITGGIMGLIVARLIFGPLRPFE